MSVIQQQPDPEKLSDTLGRLIAHLETTEAITGQQVCELVGFLKRWLPQLQIFAADFEYAESQQGKPVALSLAASAAMRLHRRLTAPCDPLIVMRFPPAASGFVDLDRFRRPANDGGAA